MMIDSLRSIAALSGVTLQGHQIRCQPNLLLEVISSLYQEGFAYLTDLTAVDWPEHFTLVYLVGSYEFPERLTVKADLPKEKPSIASVAGIWPAANWLEREVYDMFGIVFTGHPDLRRILTPDDFQGYPLRKDFFP